MISFSPLLCSTLHDNNTKKKVNPLFDTCFIMSPSIQEKFSDAEKPQAEVLSVDPTKNIHSGLKGYENCWPTTAILGLENSLHHQIPGITKVLRPYYPHQRPRIQGPQDSCLLAIRVLCSLPKWLLEGVLQYHRDSPFCT
jgi:hypothetical protein